MNRKRNVQSNAAVSQLLMLLVSSLLLAQFLRIGVKIEQVEAEGLGDIILRQDGALWGKEYGDEHQQTAHYGGNSLPLHEHMRKSGVLYSIATALQDHMMYYEYAHLVKHLQINVVAPNKELVELMKVVSTKSRVHFLKEYEHFFEELNVGEANRPMLMAYLGLEFTPVKQIQAWFEGYLKSRGQRPGLKVVAQSCKRLLKQRSKSFNMTRGCAVGKKLLALAERLKSSVETHKTSEGKLHMAQVAFKNNLNLFMLESYLILCSHLDLQELKEEFATYKKLF